MTAAVAARFDVLCRLVGARQGHGVTLAQMGAAHALARELEAAEPDAARVAEFAARLGLDVAVVVEVSP